MPTYDSSATGVELLVNSNGRPQGRGQLTAADVASAYEDGALAGGPDESTTGLLLKKQAVVNIGFASIAAATDVEVGPTFPDNTIVMRAYYEVATTFTSATDAATIGVGFDTDDANGIVASTAISAVGNVWDAGLHEGIQDGTVANAGVKLTAARRLEITRGGGEVLTAGEMTLYVEYVVGSAT